MCEDGVEQYHFIDNGEFVKNEDGSDRIRNAKLTEGEKTDIWSAEVFPKQLKGDLSQKPALLKVLLTEIAGGPCGRRLGQTNASHLPRRLESYNDQSSAIPVSFAKEQDAASCPSCEVQRKSDNAASDAAKPNSGGIVAVLTVLSLLSIVLV